MTDILGVLSSEQARDAATRYGTPTYVYSQRLLEQAARETLLFPQAYGLTVRYAMKALPTRKILQLFHDIGLHFDASSGFEVQRARRAGIPADKIQLTAQEYPAIADDLANVVREGMHVNACSLHQLETLGELYATKGLVPKEISIRLNPGEGSGSTRKVSVGGPAASFGIWYEQLPKALELAAKYNLSITRLHTHIGSGTNPEVWQRVAAETLQLVKGLADVQKVNLGGGFKVARMPNEKATSLEECGDAIKREFTKFYVDTGRRLQLEIEPGTYLVANAGVLIAKVIDIKSTSKYDFIIVNSGMTEVLRPTLYGAQHPMMVLPKNDEARGTKEYIVAGHCCESGDVWTPAVHQPALLKPRLLTEAKVGDLLILGGAGAYCSGMCAKNYNSFPEAAELLVSEGIIKQIRKRQSLEQLMQNEL